MSHSAWKPQSMKCAILGASKERKACESVQHQNRDDRFSAGSIHSNTGCWNGTIHSISGCKLTHSLKVEEE